jgi:SNF2 family DNA or RNA helicase
VTIFDEAQKIKNPVSRMTEMAKSLETDFTLLLTGTPVENELKDLWCLIDTAIPGYLGSLKEFHATYAKPSQTDPAVVERLQRKLMEEMQPAIMLRRLKEDHLEGLPKKKTQVSPKSMPPQQAQQYQNVVSEAILKKGKRGSMLEALQQMRSCSLFSSDVGSEGLTDATVNESARLQGAIEILDKIYTKKEKVLIFLESLKLQGLLMPYLQQRYKMGRLPLRISGKENGSTRKARVDIFQSTPTDVFDIMILSPKAGGVGLTLTAANHVIHLSRWWNPAVEDQCTDRVFRIGQNKEVTIYYPQAVHPKYQGTSFDVSLHNLLEKKRELSRQVLVPSTIDSAELKALLDSTTS